MLFRIPIITAIFISCIYGIKQIKDGYHRKYFIVAVCGMIALFFSRLFYLILTVSNGNDGLMSIGVLGQSSAYLFFSTANTKFLSRNFGEDLRKKICVPATVATAAVCSIFIATAIKSGTLSEYISEGVFVVFLGNAMYISMTTICCRNKYEVCKYVTPFNICVCILIFINACQVCFATFFEGILLQISITIIMILSIIAILLMLPLLKKEMTKWKE